jgi:hypothetical protein
MKYTLGAECVANIFVTYIRFLHKTKLFIIVTHSYTCTIVPCGDFDMQTVS